MRIEIDINGMSCQHCVMAVKKEIMKLPVENAEVIIGKAVVSYDGSKVKSEDIRKSIELAGYSVRE